MEWKCPHPEEDAKVGLMGLTIMMICDRCGLVTYHRTEALIDQDKKRKLKQQTNDI